jgi:hypothetical protein
MSPRHAICAERNHVLVQIPPPVSLRWSLVEGSWHLAFTVECQHCGPRTTYWLPREIGDWLLIELEEIEQLRARGGCTHGELAEVTLQLLLLERPIAL